MFKKLVMLLLSSCSFLVAQTKQDTMDYIAREVPQVANYDVDRRSVEFWAPQKDPKDLQLVLGMKTYQAMIPIDSIDVYIRSDEFGHALVAKKRFGAKGNILFGKIGSDDYEVRNEFKILIESDDRVKVQKIEKALKHLIQLHTGRKELF